MVAITSVPALLHAALQDLHSGKVAQADRLPDIAALCTDRALRDALAAEAERAQAQAAAICEAGVKVDGPANLWMTGILDDAQRDTKMTEPGRLLDIALIGAIRNAKAAEIVSSETALALAAMADTPALHAVVAANAAAEIATDRALKACLVRLTS